MSNEVVSTVQNGLGHECFQSTWNMWISFQESFNKNWSRITGEDPPSWLLIGTLCSTLIFTFKLGYWANTLNCHFLSTSWWKLRVCWRFSVRFEFICSTAINFHWLSREQEPYISMEVDLSRFRTLEPKQTNKRMHYFREWVFKTKLSKFWKQEELVLLSILRVTVQQDI